MSYKVMIVDDEPPFIRMLKRAIHRISIRYEICAEAYNGRDALKKIQEVNPDIIFTDVKMPVMDGIQLIQEIKSKNSNIIIIIISGFKEFEYAKQALQLGVSDYLLKPIDESVLASLLDKIEVELLNKHKWMETQVINRVIKGITIEEQLYPYYKLNDNEYCCLIVKDGYYYTSLAIVNQEVNLKLECIRNYLVSELKEEQDYWLVDWQEEKETHIVIKANIIQRYFTDHLAKNLFEEVRANCKSYITCIYSIIPAKINKIADVFNHMEKRLSQQVILGESQLLCLQVKKGNVLRKHNVILTSEMERKFAYLIRTRQRETLKNELLLLLSSWEQQRYPIFVIKKIIRQLVILIEINSNNNSVKVSLGLDQQIDEVFGLSNNYGEVLRGLLDIIDGVVHYDVIDKKNVLVLLKDIDEYISIHISTPLALRTICDIYGISQPYLSGLFRKYKSCSVNEYITKMRIELAMKYLKKHPSILVKEVASIVGYSDQHYFSRIFKKVSGLSPSQFQSQQTL